MPDFTQVSVVANRQIFVPLLFPLPSSSLLLLFFFLLVDQNKLIKLFDAQSLLPGRFRSGFTTLQYTEPGPEEGRKRQTRHRLAAHAPMKEREGQKRSIACPEYELQFVVEEPTAVVQGENISYNQSVKGSDRRSMILFCHCQWPRVNCTKSKI